MMISIPPKYAVSQVVRLYQGKERHPHREKGNEISLAKVFGLGALIGFMPATSRRAGVAKKAAQRGGIELGRK